MTKLVIVAIGPASSVQDGGRHGAQRYGLTPSGAMDRLALAARESADERRLAETHESLAQLGLEDRNEAEQEEQPRVAAGIQGQREQRAPHQRDGIHPARGEDDDDEGGEQEVFGVHVGEMLLQALGSGL